MQVGIGMPATIPGATGSVLLEWARLAELGPFSSLAVLDRVLYDNYESFTALAAAAAVTQHITLASTIVIGPLRNATQLAKQASSVQSLSNGRLVLGIGLGAREDDYVVAGTDYHRRGAILARELVRLRSQWRDDTVLPTAPPPILLVGGGGGVALSRMARYADGYVHNGGPPRAFLRAVTEARAAWEDASRPGEPRLWGMGYFALGSDAHRGSAYLRDYYAFTGAFADKIAAGLLTTREELRDFMRGYRDAGCTELILFPAIARLEQMERLLDVLPGNLSLPTAAAIG